MDSGVGFREELHLSSAVYRRQVAARVLLAEVSRLGPGPALLLVIDDVAVTSIRLP